MIAFDAKYLMENNPNYYDKLLHFEGYPPFCEQSIDLVILKVLFKGFKKNILEIAINSSRNN